MTLIKLHNILTRFSVKLISVSIERDLSAEDDLTHMIP